MPRLAFGDHACDRRPEESVLDAFLRTGLSVPHACRAGSCGSCMMRAVTRNALPPGAQAGLKDTWRARGYFLACLCRPDRDFVATTVDDDVRVTVTLIERVHLEASVLRIRVRPASPFEYRAGQHVTLGRADGLARSYSIASLPQDDGLELQIRVLAGGKMSEWLATKATIGTRLWIQGPSGDCFYVPGHADQPLLLAGTGTGLAPLYGIVRDALSAGHRGAIHLFHGAATAAGFYLQGELQALADGHRNVVITPTALDVDGPIDRVVLARHPRLDGWRVFLCGDPAVVKRLKTASFVAGAALADIHADAFVPSCLPAA